MFNIDCVYIATSIEGHTFKLCFTKENYTEKTDPQCDDGFKSFECYEGDARYVFYTNSSDFNKRIFGNLFAVYSEEDIIYMDVDVVIEKEAEPLKLGYVRMLPLELQRIIFYFIPLTSIRTNEAKLIGNVISVYSIDHHHDLTRMAKMYFIKNIMPFYDYVFMTLYEDEYERCDYGREEYDTFELSSRVKYELSN
jgi:hypothetical protein